jgi:hypothetical protein
LQCFTAEAIAGSGKLPRDGVLHQAANSANLCESERFADTERPHLPLRPVRLAKDSKVAWLAHTKLTFGRRVLCGSHAPLYGARFPEGGIC